jgi:hypothetical protein
MPQEARAPAEGEHREGEMADSESNNNISTLGVHGPQSQPHKDILSIRATLYSIRGEKLGPVTQHIAKQKEGIKEYTRA